MGKEKGRAREGRRKIKGGGTGRERTKREREGKGDEPPLKMKCLAALLFSLDVDAPALLRW